METILRIILLAACGVTAVARTVSVAYDAKMEGDKATKWRGHTVKGVIATLTLLFVWGFAV